MSVEETDDGTVPQVGWRDDEDPWRTVWTDAQHGIPQEKFDDADEESGGTVPRASRVHLMRSRWNRDTAPSWFPWEGNGNPRPKEDNGSIWGALFALGFAVLGSMLILAFWMGWLQSIGSEGGSVFDWMRRFFNPS